jgi:hypothetical protein
MDYQLGPGPLQVDQNTIDEKIKGDIGIVENGDVATHAIPRGYYVIWKGDLYVAKTDISSGTTLSTSNLTAKPNGIGADVATLSNNLDNVISESILTDLNYVPSKINLVYMRRYSNTSQNVPDNSSGMVFTLKIATNGDSIIQFAISFSLKIYTRRKASGTWGEWMEK